MFLEVIQHTFLKKIHVIHIQFHEKEERCHVLATRIDKNKIDILGQETYDSLEELTNNLSKQATCLVLFSGNKIISKRTSASNPDHLNELLFNNDPEDFYISSALNGTHNLVSVSRKSFIDPFLEKLQLKGINILDFSIGPYVLENLKQWFPNKETIQFSQGAYIFGSHFEYVSQGAPVPIEPFKIDEYTIAAEQLHGFATVVEYIAKTAKTNYTQESAHLREEAIFKRAFKVLGVAMLVVFFSMLLTSYVLQTIYAKKNGEILQEVALYNEKANQIGKLKKDVNYKKSIIANSSLKSESFLSFYMHEIVRETPETIQLNSLSIFPIHKPSKASEKIPINTNQIEVEGFSASNETINHWLLVLEAYPWIKQINLKDFEQKKGIYYFKFLIEV